MNGFTYSTGAQNERKNMNILLTSLSSGDTLDLVPSIYIFNYTCFTGPSPRLYFYVYPILKIIISCLPRAAKLTALKLLEIILIIFSPFFPRNVDFISATFLKPLTSVTDNLLIVNPIAISFFLFLSTSLPLLIFSSLSSPEFYDTEASLFS